MMVSNHCAVGVLLGAIPHLYCSPLTIGNYYPLLVYATVQHHSLGDNDSNNSRSACTPRQEAASIVSRIVAWVTLLTSTTFGFPVLSGFSQGIILLHGYFVPPTLLQKFILELPYPVYHTFIVSVPPWNAALIH
jgi:hypothetical protein